MKSAIEFLSGLAKSGLSGVEDLLSFPESASSGILQSALGPLINYVKGDPGFAEKIFKGYEELENPTTTETISDLLLPKGYGDPQGPVEKRLQKGVRQLPSTALAAASGASSLPLYLLQGLGTIAGLGTEYLTGSESAGDVADLATQLTGGVLRSGTSRTSKGGIDTYFKKGYEDLNAGHKVTDLAKSNKLRNAANDVKNRLKPGGDIVSPKAAGYAKHQAENLLAKSNSNKKLSHKELLDTKRQFNELIYKDKNVPDGAHKYLEQLRDSITGTLKSSAEKLPEYKPTYENMQLLDNAFSAHKTKDKLRIPWGKNSILKYIPGLDIVQRIAEGSKFLPDNPGYKKMYSDIKKSIVKDNIPLALRDGFKLFNALSEDKEYASKMPEHFKVKRNDKTDSSTPKKDVESQSGHTFKIKRNDLQK